MLDDLDPGVELYPLWRQVLIRFHEAVFADGDLVSHAWLYEQFECDALNNPKITWEQAQKLRFKLLGQFVPFRKALLEQHQIMLRPEIGLGYIIILPREQTQRSYNDRMANIKRELRDMNDEMVNVRESLLTAEERRERADLLAQAGMLRRMLRPARELPPADDE